MLSRNSFLALGLVGVLGAYGAYELVTRVVLVGDEELAVEGELVPEQVDDVKNEEVPEVVNPVQNDVVDKADVPKENVDVEEPKKEVQNSSVPKDDKVKTETNLKNNVEGNEDKNTLLQNLSPGSLGYKFKNHLLGDPNDPAWDAKLRIWATTSKRQVRNSPFNVNRNTNITKEQLTQRCKNTYQVPWNQIPGSRSEDKLSYKSAVWTHCSKSENMPKDWI